VDEDSESRTINAVDSGLLELKAAVQNLNIQIESVQSRIKEYDRHILSPSYLSLTLSFHVGGQRRQRPR